MKRFWPLVMVAIMIAVLAGCSSTGTVKKTAGTSVEGLEIPIEQAAVKLVGDLGGADYKLVSTEDLKAWMDEGKDMIIISSLPPADDTKMGKLKGAVNAEMPKTEEELTQENTDNILDVAGSDKDKTIVIYCGFVGCRRSHHGAKILAENGYSNVYRYIGGIVAWEEAGNEVVK